MLKNTQPEGVNNRIMSRTSIIELASRFSFTIKFERPRNTLVRFHRDEGTEEYTMIDVWYSAKRPKLTVGVYKKDLPTKDKSAFLHDVSEEDLVEVFNNPNSILL